LRYLAWVLTGNGEHLENKVINGVHPFQKIFTF